MIWQWWQCIYLNLRRSRKVMSSRSLHHLKNKWQTQLFELIPWRVRTNSMQKRPPLTHENNLKSLRGMLPQSMHYIAKFRFSNEGFLPLDMVTKPKNAHKYIKVSFIINIVFLLHVSATHMANTKKNATFVIRHFYKIKCICWLRYHVQGHGLFKRVWPFFSPRFTYRMKI